MTYYIIVLLCVLLLVSLLFNAKDQVIEPFGDFKNLFAKQNILAKEANFTETIRTPVLNLISRKTPAKICLQTSDDEETCLEQKEAISLYTATNVHDKIDATIDKLNAELTKIDNWKKGTGETLQDYLEDNYHTKQNTYGKDDIKDKYHKKQNNLLTLREAEQLYLPKETNSNPYLTQSSARERYYPKDNANQMYLTVDNGDRLYAPRAANNDPYVTMGFLENYPEFSPYMSILRSQLEKELELERLRREEAERLAREALENKGKTVIATREGAITAANALKTKCMTNDAVKFSDAVQNRVLVATQLVQQIPFNLSLVANQAKQKIITHAQTAKTAADKAKQAALNIESHMQVIQSSTDVKFMQLELSKLEKEVEVCQQAVNNARKADADSLEELNRIQQEKKITDPLAQEAAARTEAAQTIQDAIAQSSVFVATCDTTVSDTEEINARSELDKTRNAVREASGKASTEEDRETLSKMEAEQQEAERQAVIAKQQAEQARAEKAECARQLSLCRQATTPEQARQCAVLAAGCQSRCAGCVSACQVASSACQASRIRCQEYASEIVTAAEQTPSYAFTSMKFTNAGAVGPEGPSYDMCIKSYSTNAPWVSNKVNFDVPVKGFQVWIVPETAAYKFTIAGAMGGGMQGGQGHIGDLTVSLRKGTILVMVIGQKGSTSSAKNGGGGGGTYVFMMNRRTINTLNQGDLNDANIIGIAGGGGGSGTAKAGHNAGLNGDSTGGSFPSGGSAVINSKYSTGGGGGGTTSVGGMNGINLNISSTGAFQDLEYSSIGSSGFYGFPLVSGALGGYGGNSSFLYSPESRDKVSGDKYDDAEGNVFYLGPSGGFGGGGGGSGSRTSSPTAAPVDEKSIEDKGLSGGGGGGAGGGGGGGINGEPGGGGFSHKITIRGFNNGDHGYVTIEKVTETKEGFVGSRKIKRIPKHNPYQYMLHPRY